MLLKLTGNCADFSPHQDFDKLIRTRDLEKQIVELKVCRETQLLIRVDPTRALQTLCGWAS